MVRPWSALVGICYISLCHVWVAVCQYSPVVFDYGGVHPVLVVDPPCRCSVHSVFGGGPTVVHSVFGGGPTV